MPYDTTTHMSYSIRGPQFNNLRSLQTCAPAPDLGLATQEPPPKIEKTPTHGAHGPNLATIAFCIFIPARFSDVGDSRFVFKLILKCGARPKPYICYAY